MYAVIRFMPFAETREFANVGIVIIAPKLGFFDFKLAPKTFGRVTKFFDDLDGVVYKHALESFEGELERIRNYLTHNYVQGEGLVEYFKEITRPRESVLHFGEIGTLLTDNVSVSVETLYDRLIGRNFATSKEYKEQQMVRVLKNQLISKLPKDVRYTKQNIKAGMFDITMPLVTQINSNYRIIRPLAFEQKNVLQAMEHGETWVNRLRKLVNSEVLEAKRALFVLEKPLSRKLDFMKVYEDVSSEIRSIGAIAENFSETSRIIEFAAADLSPESVEQAFH
jgi:hypothetical protein